MIKRALLFLCLFLLTLSGAEVRRSIQFSGAAVFPRKVAVIAAPGNKMAAFAAEEAFRLLKRGGVQVVQVRKPQADALNLIIGKNPAYPVTVQDMSQFPSGAFRIIREKDNVYIFGVDTPSADVKKLTRPNAFGYRKGSLYGTYDFLERFAGVRFYFPGEVGTVVPAKKLAVPAQIDILDFPDMEERSYLPWVETSGKMYPNCHEYKRPPAHLLNTLRLRSDTISPGMTNALQRGNYLKRFYKTHPEYFALYPNGKRLPEVRKEYSTQFCLNSGIEEEIYQDINAYFLGKPASSRGLDRWSPVMFSPRGVNMTHDDAFFWCACAKCRKAGLDKDAYKNPAVRKRISTEVWKFTARIANRLKKEKVPNARIIMLAYVPYDIVPDCDIPDNILPVVVVFPGVQGDTPTLKRNDNVIKAWQKKCNGRILLRAWTGKYMLRRFPGVPDFHHNILCDYFKQRKDWFSGVFLSECIDYFLFRHLNLYLFFKYAWNNNADLKSVMDEYFVNMYGKGAPFIREYFDILEKIWDKELIKGMKDSMMGGEAVIANEIETWTQVFSPARIKHFDSLWDKAARAVRNDKAASMRVKFMRESLYAPLLARQMKFAENQKAIGNWVMRPGETVWARPRKGSIAEVITTFRVIEKKEALEFDFNCQEPAMKHIRAAAVKDCTGEVWRDSEVEIFLNPSGDRKNFIQFCINANGVMDTFVYGKLQKKNISSLSVKRNQDSWNGKLVIPKTMLGKYRSTFPALLARRRVLKKTGPKVKEEFYAWLAIPDPPNFHTPEYWGLIDLSGKKSSNMLKDGTLEGLDINDWKSRRFFVAFRDKPNQKISFDKKCFVSGGQSVLFESRSQKGQMSFQLPVSGLKPDTKYRLSFFCKLDNVKGEGLDVSLYAGNKAIHPMRLGRLSGTHPWNRLSYEITTWKNIPEKGVVIVALRAAAGTMRVDNICLEEIPPVREQGK